MLDRATGPAPAGDGRRHVTPATARSCGMGARRACAFVLLTAVVTLWLARCLGAGPTAGLDH